MSDSECSSSPAPTLPDDVSRLMEDILNSSRDSDSSQYNISEAYHDNIATPITIEVSNSQLLLREIQNENIINNENEQQAYNKNTHNANFEVEGLLRNNENATKLIPIEDMEITIYDDLVATESKDSLEADVQLTVIAAINKSDTRDLSTAESEDTERHVNNEPVTTTSTKTRKRCRNPESWVQNVRKTKRERGEGYKDRKGKEHPPREIKGGCRAHCSYKCEYKISVEERRIVFEQFWKLSDSKKSHFYSKFVKKGPMLRRRGKTDKIRKMTTYQYFFEINSVLHKVCKDFFLKTLDISSRRIYYFFANIQNVTTSVPRSPTKGKNQKKYISDEDKNLVRQHINSFETVSSHYCRENTDKKYLASDLSINRMYSLYLEMVPLDKNPVKKCTYSKIFNTECNISFQKPKEDLCDQCEEHKMMKNPTDVQQQKFDEHLRNKELGRNERNRDRDLGVISRDSIAIVTFDLENVFALPKCNISKAFYLKKLNCYNLTGHCSTNGITYCSIWHEHICGRAANHLASALVNILTYVMKDNPTIKKIILWSDSCVPQNRNSIMSIALEHFLHSENSKGLEVIEQKFSEPGHGNLQEVDLVHSVIERYLRYKDVKSPVTLVRQLVQIPKHYKTKLKVLQMDVKHFFNYQAVSLQYTFNVIAYTKVKNLIYERASPFTVKHRNSFASELTVTKILKATPTRRGVNNNTSTGGGHPLIIEQLSESYAGLKSDKVKHLQEMLKFMEGVDLEFYTHILRKNVSEDNTSNAVSKFTSKVNPQNNINEEHDSKLVRSKKKGMHKREKKTSYEGQVSTSSIATRLKKSCLKVNNF